MGRGHQQDRERARQLTQRQPRLHDPGFLRFLRKKPCIICGTLPSDACHIRFGSEAYGKRAVGIGEKPDDRWCVAMCRRCHMLQHGMNEQEFWRERRMLPLLIAQKFYSEYGGTGGKVRHKRKPRVTIVPKGFGTAQKMPSRPFPKTRRKIQSRGFQ